jgi:hypothetical protein
MLCIVALFDHSGYSVARWAELGAQCYCLDIKNSTKKKEFPSGGSISWIKWDYHSPESKAQIKQLAPALLINFPPCTDLTVAGAKHFVTKRLRNENFHLDALAMAKFGSLLAQELEIPSITENPVGVLSTLWRKPDFQFDPCDYGGYLPENDKHPESAVIPPRDGYKKKTCFWITGKLVIPAQRGVRYLEITDSKGRKFAPQVAFLGGKSEQTKTIRALSPRGFFIAFCEANWSLLTGKELESPSPIYRHVYSAPAKLIEN